MSWNLILKVIYPHFCFILLVTQTNWGQCGKDYTRV